MDIKSQAEQYAEIFRFEPNTKGWYQQKVDDFTAGYEAAIRQLTVVQPSEQLLQMIEQWEEKHSSILNEYCKGNANNEVMQMYRSQMKNILDFIEQLMLLKNTLIIESVS
jgi:hypothetical protein